jgi:putative membrane protein
MEEHMSGFWRHGIPGAALALAVTLGGCGGGRNDAANTGETGSAGSASTADTAMTSASADTGSMSAGGGQLTDANIVALLDEANKADSASGATASAKATSPAVKQFAKLMMSEHHALRVQGQQLAKKAQITPSAPSNDPLAPLAQQESSTLQSTPKGAEFDRAYIEQEIAVHRAVSDLLDQAKSAAQNEQLKGLITKAQPVIQKHLDQAESIQKKLSPST